MFAEMYFYLLLTTFYHEYFQIFNFAFSDRQNFKLFTNVLPMKVLVTPNNIFGKTVALITPKIFPVVAVKTLELCWLQIQSFNRSKQLYITTVHY